MLWSNNHNKLGHEDVGLHGAARQKVIADLHVSHGDRIAPLAQRSVFVQFNRLRHVVGAQNGNLWRIDAFDFASDIVLAQRASLHVRSAALAIDGARANGLRGPGVIGIFLAADGNYITDFEVAALGRLPIFAKFRLRSDLDRDVVAVGIGNFQCCIVDRGDLAKQRHAALFIAGLLIFALFVLA